MENTPYLYLYGAAVQGIQGFIFQTNELKDIVGASELVENICTTAFQNLLGKSFDENSKVVMAAGNIKYVFNNEEECREAVLKFPKKVMEMAPGITISQAVVRYVPDTKEDGSGKGFEDAVQELESRLRIQRNKLMRNTTIGLMGIERSRQTGLPVSRIVNGQHLDEGTYMKWKKRRETTQRLCVKALGKDEIKPECVPFEIVKMTGLNDWIAIIHADGNGVGQVVQKVGNNPQKLRQFSEKLDQATTRAAVCAFNSLGIPDGTMIPVRPIVLSGDDHTLICRADLALKYVEAFIESFEKETKNLLGKGEKGEIEGSLLQGVFKDGKNYLTACVGIAFIKSSYPFYYGYQLAEALCDRAKKDTKVLYDANSGQLPGSCIMFHKIQDSFVTGYEDIVKRELTPQPNISFEFGPYYINAAPNGRWKLEQLRKMSSELEVEEMHPVKVGLRKWLSLIHQNPEVASQRLDRLKYISGKENYIAELTTSRRENGKMVYPVYDILVLNAINTQDTKTKKRH